LNPSEATDISIFQLNTISCVRTNSQTVRIRSDNYGPEVYPYYLLSIRLVKWFEYLM